MMWQSGFPVVAWARNTQLGYDVVLCEFKEGAWTEAVVLADSAADEEEEIVESRYSRNSARLPRIGVDAATASSVTASLRRNMTGQDDEDDDE